MRQNYNSFNYWEKLINENRTIRGHMLMNKLPTKDSLYIHTLIFSKDGGLNNIWSYFPNPQALLGYIQYSFLPEAFYTWINCRGGGVSHVPVKPVEEIIRQGESSKKITKEEAIKMKEQVNMVTKCWGLPRNRIFTALKKFMRDFNRSWYGDDNEFLYLKIFQTPDEVGEFVIESTYMTSSEEGRRLLDPKKAEEWKNVCKYATEEKKYGEIFKEILEKKLTEVI